MTTPNVTGSRPLLESSYAPPAGRVLVQMTLDAAAWGIAILTALILRLEFALPQLAWPGLCELVAAVAVGQLVSGWTLRLYRGRYILGSFEEALVLSVTVAITGAAGTSLTLVAGEFLGVPRSTVPIAVPIALLFMFAARYSIRAGLDARARPAPSARPALVYGAGHVGAAIVRLMLTDPASPYVPVGLIDDDRRKRHSRIRGVEVVGSIDDLASGAGSVGAEILIVAIAHADAALMRRATDVSRRLGLEVKVVPALGQALDGANSARALRDISIEDIVGRRAVDTNVESIAGYLTGRRVLVTGAGGSIGQELCREIHRFSPSELIMLDRDETALQTVELAICGHGLLDGPEVVLADIRDAAAINRVFAERRPEVVFHAAALKHLPMLQQYPEEAWKTNVMGTRNVLTAAREAGVSAFVNISTDKAANPASVLGHSKRMAERLTAWTGEQTGAAYLSVRFGNVLGSRGSMLPLFSSMIANGGPVTVTDPEVTRYFMTIPEACQLVLQAGGIGRPGEVLILDMGEPVRILDIAKHLIGISGKEIPIVFTGLRDGEKMHEDLLAEGERDDRPLHPRISHASVLSISPDELDVRRSLEEWLQGVAVDGIPAVSRDAGAFSESLFGQLTSPID